MVSSLEELGVFLEQNNITPADIEYIVNFMNKENMSPQLAMRRIKAFDSLKAKLEDNDEKEKIDLLEQELHEIKNQLMEKNQLIEEMRQEKTGLETEKEKLETKSELMVSEKEELQRQLELIKEMQFDDEDDEKIEIEKLKNLQQKIQDLENNEKYSSVIQPINKAISQIINQEDFDFDIDNYKKSLDDVLDKPGQNKSSISSGKSPIGTDGRSDQQVAINQEVTQKIGAQKPDKKEDTVEVEKSGTIKTTTKEESQEKKVTEKEEQVLNLFLEFIEEAETDKGFQERVSTICDMDEAYQYLGSIGLSQVYSFASRGIDKKKELQDLLKSWKKEGIPR